MKDFKQYVENFQEGNEYGIFFIENNLQKENTLTQDNIEHILDFVYANKKKYTGIGLELILKKANAWNKKLITNASKTDNEIEGEDYEVVKDFKDGFKFVKLISEATYKREGSLMGHCVASYYGRDVTIYSLRDKKNLPHCTIEDNNQVKGKGNQTVDNKYFGYCIEFLEEQGITMGENEMKNLGYYKLDNIDKNLSCSKLWKGYISDKDIDSIKDKKGNKYEGFGLLNIKSLFEFDLDMKVKFNFDIKKITSYFNKNNKSEIAEDNATVSAGNYAKVSAGNYATVSAGYNAKVSAEDNAKVSAEDNAKVSAEDNATVSAGNYATVSAGNYATVSAEDNATVSAGNYAKVSAGNYATVSAEDNAKVSAGYNATVSAEDNAKVSAGNYATVSAGKQSNVITGINSELESLGDGTLLVGRNGSKAKGKIGTWIVLTEEDRNNNILNVQTIRIDGKIIKEDTLYVLKGGEFVEYKD